MKRLALSILSLMVLFGLFEGVLQIREIGKKGEILAGRSPEDLGTVEADLPLLYTLKADWQGKFNSHGFRDIERSKAKAENVFRLAVVGDSVTMQMTVPLEKLYGRRLESLLGETLPGWRIECPLFGVTGYGAEQALALMRTEVLDFEPDAILWQFHLNDAADPVIDGGNGGLGRYYDPTRSQVVAYLRRKVDHILKKRFLRQHSPGLEHMDLKLQAWRWDEVGRVVDKVSEMSRDSGVPVFVVVFPSFPGGGHWAQGYSDADMELYRAMIERFEANGLPVLDLMPVFKGFEVAEIQQEPGDLWHPNVRGHRVMAQAISQWLIEGGLINKFGP